MKARDIIGRKITGLVQQRHVDQNGKAYMHLNYLELEGGLYISFRTIELEGEYGLEATLHRSGASRAVPTLAPPQEGEDPGIAKHIAELRAAQASSYACSVCGAIPGRPCEGDHLRVPRAC